MVEAIALQRIGHAADVETQLTLLGQLTGIDPETAKQTVVRIKDSPGFVALTPRYFYVTPKAIAEIAFHSAWRRWASTNPSAFLDRIPEELLASCHARVRVLANPDVRSYVAAHFRQQGSRLA